MKQTFSLAIQYGQTSDTSVAYSQDNNKGKRSQIMFNQTALVSEMDGLRRFALRLTGNAVDADDLMQSTLLRAMEKKDYFQAGTDLFKWTSKIMFNLFVSSYRRKKKFETRYDPESYLDKVVVPSGQEDQTELTEVREAMRTLSREHREILVMVCVKGMRYQEVAANLDLPVGTVRSRLSRARERLQIALDDNAAERALIHQNQFARAYSHVGMLENVA
jgi:RNA polymerase sigma-70 factor (ECF subfamily)